MFNTTKFLRLVAALTIAVTACTPQPDAAAHAQAASATALATEAQTANTQPAAIDSLPGIAEQVHEFKAKLSGTPPTTLSSGATSRDALVSTLIRAIESNDRLKADSMTLNAWEFIEFYYPNTAYTRPPYELEPQHVWLLQRADNDKGFRRLFDRYGGDKLGFNGYRCDVQPVMQERNRIWSNCVVSWNPSRGAPIEMQIFAAIIERDGRFKFLSYANDF